MWKHTFSTCLALAATSTAVRRLHRLAASAGSTPPAGSGTHGPLTATRGSTSATATAGNSSATDPSSAGAAARSYATMMADMPFPPAPSAELREQALAWAEAISATGEALLRLDFDEEALGCLEVAGALLERAGL